MAFEKPNVMVAIERKGEDRIRQGMGRNFEVMFLNAEYSVTLATQEGVNQLQHRERTSLNDAIIRMDNRDKDFIQH